jgi:dihydropyrimidinase
MDLVIKHGTVVTPDGRFRADVGVVDQRIVAVGQDLDGARALDAAGCYVLPGAVDPHVHLQMPSGEYVSADDFASGTVAAACGGTTTLIDFVEPVEGQSLMQAFEARRAEAEDRVAVDYGLHMTIPAWHAERAETFDALVDVVAAGLPTFKLYMAYEGLRLTDEQLYRVMRAVAAAGGLPIVHCENGPVCEALRAEAVAYGDLAPIYHARTRPPRQEAEAVGRAIDMAALARSALYVVHVSCAASLARILAARGRGEVIYGETCPQYLVLDERALAGEDGPLMICAPPLRAEPDRRALWDALIRGGLDVLATDHCPFAEAEKRGHEAFTTIPGGLPAVEARLSLAHHFGGQRGLSLERWAAVCCATPARIFGLERKGHVAPGFDADLVIFDPERAVTLEPGRTLHEQVTWSPYAGLSVRGWPRDVLSRGRVIVRAGEFVGEPGWGRFVARRGRDGCV